MTERDPLVLLVEDDPDFRKSLAALIRKDAFRVEETGTLAAARDALATVDPDLVILDLELPDGDGLELKLHAELRPDTPFVVLTGRGTRETRRMATRLGASDYLTKPLDPQQLTAVLHDVRKGRALRDQVALLRATLREAGRFGSMVGRSPRMQRVYDLIARVSPTSAPVLITGESGTGKELAARTIHDASPRRPGPFIAINCGAIPASLVESRLFGHEKGAFTGAESRHKGVFELADGGTLFLDEIGEMPGELQVRLLRVLETSSFTRVGGSENIEVDVRIVAATNRDPQEALDKGRLREDLFHRLNVFPIELPPLRVREGDVEQLAVHFLEEMNREQGTRKRFDPAALGAVAQARWPGNVRELRNTVQRAWILADDSITSADLPAIARQGAAGPGSTEDGIFIAIGTPMEEAARKLVLATLAACDDNRRKAAEALGISVRTLYNRLNEYGARERTE